MKLSRRSFLTLLGLAPSVALATPSINLNRDSLLELPPFPKLDNIPPGMALVLFRGVGEYVDTRVANRLWCVPVYQAPRTISLTEIALPTKYGFAAHAIYMSDPKDPWRKVRSRTAALSVLAQTKGLTPEQLVERFGMPEELRQSLYPQMNWSVREAVGEPVYFGGDVKLGKRV